MKIALAPLIGDARGSAGMLTMYQSKAGLCARIKATPFQPMSPAQFLQRASLVSLSKTWKTPAMAAYRADWIILANANPYLDVFNVQQRLTGCAFFIKLNRNLATLGLTPIFAAPSSVSCGSPGLLTLAHVTGPPAQFTVTPTTNPTANEAVVIRATKPLSQGVLTLANTQTIIQTFAAGTAGPWDIITKYLAKHATVQTDTQIFVQVNYVNTTTGYAGQDSINSLVW